MLLNECHIHVHGVYIEHLWYEYHGVTIVRGSTVIILC